MTPFAGVIDGTIYWESVEVGDDGRVSSVEDYLKKIDDSGMSAAAKERVRSELAVLQKNIDTAINTIESDPTVQYCMTGREVQGMKNKEGTRTKIGERSPNAARFPELTKQMRSVIAAAALKSAKDNYYSKYDELNQKMLKDYVTIGERMAEIAGENSLDARREIARVACINFADAASLPNRQTRPETRSARYCQSLPLRVRRRQYRLRAVHLLRRWGGLTIGQAAIAAGAIATSAIGLTGSGVGKANGADSSVQRELIGSKSLNQWNYKETITSTFEWETLNCHKCVRAQNCTNKKNPIFGCKYCKSWADPVETCTDTQF